MRALAALLIAWPAAVQGADWTGIWAADPDWCRYADSVGTSDPGPIRLSATRMEGYENRCEIVMTQRLGTLNAWFQRRACMAEGETFETENTLMLSDPDTLWIYGAYGAPTRLTRCG